MIDYTNHSPSELIQEINRLKAQLSNRKGSGDISDGKRIAELLSQNGQLRKELHATNINLEAAKAAVGVQSQNEEFVFRARRAAMRPIIKKWRSVLDWVFMHLNGIAMKHQIKKGKKHLCKNVE